MKNQLLVKQYQLGPMDNFLYLLGDPSTKEMAIVDPAWDVPFLLSEVERLGYKLTKTFLTHAHHDHVNGLAELQSICKVPTYVSKHELPLFTAKLKDLTPIAPNAKLPLGNIVFDALYTPGHSPGCQIFLADGHAICGDLIFVHGCGRCDLPGSDPKAMYDSLYNVLMKLPDSTMVYCGHDYGETPTGTIGGLKKTNPYLQCSSLDEFLSDRMGI